MTDHPITPPPELVQQWREEADQYQDDPKTYFDHVATEAARWGADMELEACCEWLHWQNLVTHQDLIPLLRTARRPKPPSLKEQALQELERVVTLLMPVTGPNKVERFAIIRRALEQLDD